MSEQTAPPETTEGGSTTEERSFTQADVDRIVSDRLKRERDKLGDIEGLKAKASKFDELEAASKSELEKAIARAEAAEKKATDAEERAKRTSVRAAITAAATKVGFIDPSDAHLFLDAEQIEFDGDEPKNLDKILGALAKSKPHLIGEAKGDTGSGDGGPRGRPDKGDPAQQFGDLITQKLSR